jgi:hypothetical protein
MDYPNPISGDVLRAVRHDTTDAKMAKQHMAALAYKDGEGVSILSERTASRPRPFSTHSTG